MGDLHCIQCCNPESPHFYFNYLTALAEVFTLDNIHGVQTCLDDKVESINDAFGSDDSNSPFQRMTVNNLFLSLSIPKHIFKVLYVRTRVAVLYTEKELSPNLSLGKVIDEFPLKHNHGRIQLT